MFQNNGIFSIELQAFLDKKSSQVISGQLKIDPADSVQEGGIIWEKTYGLDNSNEFGTAVKQTTDGGYIIAGYSLRGIGILVLKLDEGGNIIWKKRYWGSRYHKVSSIEQTCDGYVVAGDTDSFGDEGNLGIWILKLDNNGSLL